MFYLSSYKICFNKSTARGFNGFVNIPESCDFRSQFDPENINFLPFLLLFGGIQILNENV